MKRFTKFTGKTENEINDFFEDFEHLAKIHEASRADMVRTLTELLTGPALKVYNSMDHNDRESYSMLKSTIYKKIVLNDNRTITRARYKKRTQSSNESV